MSLTRLASEVSLKGRLEEITMMELRSSPGEIVQAVELGKTFIIKRAGKAVAVLSQVPNIGRPSVELMICVDENGKISYEAI